PLPTGTSEKAESLTTSIQPNAPAVVDKHPPPGEPSPHPDPKAIVLLLVVLFVPLAFFMSTLNREGTFFVLGLGAALGIPLLLMTQGRRRLVALPASLQAAHAMWILYAIRTLSTALAVPAYVEYAHLTLYIILAVALVASPHAVTVFLLTTYQGFFILVNA